MVEKVRQQRPIRYSKDAKEAKPKVQPDASAGQAYKPIVAEPQNLYKPSYNAPYISAGGVPAFVTNPNYICEEHNKKECQGYVASQRKFVCSKCIYTVFMTQGRITQLLKNKKAEEDKRKIRNLVINLQEKLRINYSKMIGAIENSGQTSKINSYFDDHQNDLQSLQNQMTKKGVNPNEFDTIFSLRYHEEFSNKIGSNVSPTTQFMPIPQNPDQAIEKARRYFKVSSINA